MAKIVNIKMWIRIPQNLFGNNILKFGYLVVLSVYQISLLIFCHNISNDKIFYLVIGFWSHHLKENKIKSLLHFSLTSITMSIECALLFWASLDIFQLLILFFVVLFYGWYGTQRRKKNTFAQQIWTNVYLLFVFVAFLYVHF